MGLKRPKWTVPLMQAGVSPAGLQNQQRTWQKITNCFLSLRGRPPTITKTHSHCGQLSFVHQDALWTYCLIQNTYTHSNKLFKVSSLLDMCFQQWTQQQKHRFCSLFRTQIFLLTTISFTPHFHMRSCTSPSLWEMSRETEAFLLNLNPVAPGQ